MIIIENEDGLLIKEVNCFDLDLTLDCGQAFRWRKNDAGLWHGVAFGKALNISQTGDGITLFHASMSEFETVWRSYFDLDRDYSGLCDGFCADSSLKSAIGLFPGIRVLRQEPWEALCSFIISQNNNIPRIKGIIERLCANFGAPVNSNDFAFPAAKRISTLSVEDLAPIRAGFRSNYIIDAAQKVASGEVSLPELGSKPIDEARSDLTKIKGVGSKVAECTLLYGCGRAEAFPVDVWVKRVMAELYPDGLPECVKGSQGIAQQYLFHWRRQQ
jgi:N-glycosylase/DNA lyase